GGSVSITVGYGSGDNGTLHIRNGGDANSSGATFLGLSTSSSGTVIVDGNGSRLRSSNSITVGNQGTAVLTVRNGGVGEIPGDDIILGGSSGSGTLNIGDGAGAGTVNVASVRRVLGNEAILNFNHDEAGYFFTNDGTSGGSPVLIMGDVTVNHVGTGATMLTGANTYTGGTTVHAGILVVANTTGSATGTGTVRVKNGGTLAGNGFITGAVTVEDGGVLAPGTSPGTLTVGELILDSGSILEFELAAPGGTPG